jgi:hypothetical protein
VLGHAALAEFEPYQVRPQVQHDRRLLDPGVNAHAELERGRGAALIWRDRRVHHERLQAVRQPDVPARDLE